MCLEVSPEFAPVSRGYLLDGTTDQVDAPRNEYDATLLTGYLRGCIYGLDGIGDEKRGALYLGSRATGNQSMKCRTADLGSRQSSDTEPTLL